MYLPLIDDLNERYTRPINMKQEIFTRPDNGDVDQGWAILAICWAFIACALLSTILRVWVRSRIMHNLGSDDYVAVAAMVSALTPLFQPCNHSSRRVDFEVEGID